LNTPLGIIRAVLLRIIVSLVHLLNLTRKDSTPMVNILPDANRIQGILFQPAQTPNDAQLQLQYTSADGKWHQVTMPFLDAMYLLSLLKGVQAETGFRIPDDPFVPTDLHDKPTPTGTISADNLKLLDLNQPVTVTWVPALKITASPIGEQQSRSFLALKDGVVFVMESLRKEDRPMALAMTNRGLLRIAQFEELYRRARR
jgi:hypothetical protein